MKLVVSKIVNSVTEIELDLDGQNWEIIKSEIKTLQLQGEFTEVDVSTKQKFIETFLVDETIYSALYDIFQSRGIGKEETFLDVSNEYYEGKIEN